MMSLPLLLPTPRFARRYASDAIVALLHRIATSPQLGLVIDLDALERSVLARFDRVMLRALESLAIAGVQVVLIAKDQRDRASRLARTIRSATIHSSSLVELRAGAPGVSWIVISDDGALLAETSEDDRALVLGRPEAASVRATLWWLLDERTRAA